MGRTRVLIYLSYHTARGLVKSVNNLIRKELSASIKTMRISFNTPILPDELEKSNGYGYATDRMLASLEKLGYEVSYNDPTAEVGLCFNQPQHWKFYGNQYKIGYHPWESTQLLPGWAEIMNDCDEIWTPSPLIAQWYQNSAGITRPIFVYEHGVDSIWTPKQRKVEDKFKFLHVGSEASRKGGSDTMTAFSKAFPKNKDVELNMKIISPGWNIGAINRINIINTRIGIDELVEIFHSNHAYVYPSYGEGFGLTPLQAMATGMPTATVETWAPYAQFLDDDLKIDSSFVKSPWPRIHPGAMLKPKMDDIVDSMRLMYTNYENLHASALNRVDSITQYYNWDRLTKQVFSDLEDRLKSL